jgi:hypothetical protein
VKYIVKQAEPQAFTDWKRRPRTYERFKKSAPIKEVVKDSLMQEQGYLCCYCERRLINEDSHKWVCIINYLNSEGPPSPPNLGGTGLRSPKFGGRGAFTSELNSLLVFCN